MIINFKKIVSNLIYTTIPAFMLDNLSISKNKKDKIKIIFKKSNNTDVLKLTNQNFLHFAFEKKYLSAETIFNEINIDKNISCIKSYVPFIKDKTNLLIFNFMELHYGVRDPVLCKIRIIDDECDYGNINFFLSSSEVKYINQIDEDYFNNLPNLGKAEVHFYHPKIPKNIIEKQIRFFGIYNNSNKEITSGVHSMPCLQNKICSQKKVFTRNFGDNKTNFNFLNDHSINNALLKKDISELRLNELKNEKKIYANGYYIPKNLSGKSIWHDADQTKKYASFKNDNLECFTSFVIPNYNKNLPILHFNSKDLGVKPPFTVNISLVSENEVMTNKKIIIEEDNYIFDFKDLNFQSEKQTKVFIKFFNIIDKTNSFEPQLMIHYYFRGDQGDVMDQGHTVKSTGYDNNIFNIKRSFRCKKFAPFFNSKRQYTLYSIANVGIGELSHEHKIKIRVFLTNGEEFLFTKKIKKNDIAVISTDEILKENLKLSLDENKDVSGVLYIEYDRKNFSAQWYVCNKENNLVATDHFTGG